MALREVLKSFTFEQQRQEINNIAQDVGDVSLLSIPQPDLVTAINAIGNTLNPTSGLFLNGVGDPTPQTGFNGDFYLNVTTNELFGPKEDGQWPTDPISFTGLLYGENIPSPADGVVGSFYINTVTKDLYGPKTESGWSLAAISLSEQILSGTDAPQSTLGKDGDYYLDTQSRDLYGPKSSGSWGSPISLSEQLLSGAGAPLSTLGKDGDFYLDVLNRNFYGPKSSGSWDSFIPLSEEEVGSVIFVRPDGNDTKNGLSIRNAVRTLKKACEIAALTNGNITIRMFSGEYFEDNPIYVPKGTSIVGDNLRETILRPLNDGEDFLWVTSGCYINYLVFRDNYGDVLNPEDSARGYGFLNTGSLREISATDTTINVFPGHTLKSVDLVYKDAANIVEYKKLDIIDYAYSQMIQDFPSLVIPGNDGENVCKRDIGYFVDAIIHDLRKGGNLKIVQFGESYFNAAGNVEFIQNELDETKSALSYAKTIITSYVQNNSIPQEPDFLNIYDPITPANFSLAAGFVEDLTSVATSILDGEDSPRINPGPGYVLIDQEWIEVDTLVGNVITVASRGINNPVTNEPSIASRHISGAVVTQGSRTWRYAISYPNQSGTICKGRISLSSASTTVTGVNTAFTTQCFAGGKIKVNDVSYDIQSIQSDTQLTISSVPGVDVSTFKFYFIPPKERIFLSPYTQNCSAISVLGNCFYDSNTGEYDTTKTRAGGILVDGDQLEANTPIKSMVADAFTQVVSGGIGFHLKNDGYAQLVSVFEVFEAVGILCESGGYTSVTNSATNFGYEGLKAIGYSKNPYPFYEGNVSGISNITKSSFNGSPSSIVETKYEPEENDTKIKVTITLNQSDISKFEIGQKISIQDHVIPNPSNYQEISDLQVAVNDEHNIEQIISSNNQLIIVLDYAWNSLFNVSGFGGNESGTLTITQGSTYTAITVVGFDVEPLLDYVIKINGLPYHPSGEEYIVKEILEYQENNFVRFSTQIKVPDSDVLSVQNNAPINLRAPSTVNSSSHTFEYVGSGINYTALPQNGGKPNPDSQFVEANSGKSYVSATDQDGNFLVGPYFKVDLRSGKATFTGSVALGVLDELQLKLSPGVPIYEFSTDNTLGGGTGSKNTTLPTQKAVRDYINSPSVLGNLIGLNKGTSTQAGLLVQLDSNGKINPNQLPPAPTVAVFNVADEQARFDLDQINPTISQGDLAYQEDTQVTYLLASLPTNVPTNWQVFTGTNINASNIVSGVISPERLGSGISNDSSFLNGISKYTPVTQGIIPSANSPVLVSGTTNNIQKIGNILPIASITYNNISNTVTVNTEDPHGLTTNGWVEVEGVYPTGYNGIHQITVVDTDTISYTLSFDPGTYIDGGYVTGGIRYDSGFTEVDVKRAAFFNGQTSGSSDLGVVKFDYPTFSIDPSSVLTLREKGVRLSKIENIKIRSLLGNNQFIGDANNEGNVIELSLGEDVEQVPIFAVTIDPSTQKYFFRDTIINEDIGVAPSINLTKGKSYKFTVNVSGQAFYITTKPRVNPLVETSAVYNRGLKVLNRESGALFLTISQDTPRVLYYQSATNIENYGIISIVANDKEILKYSSTPDPVVLDSFSKSLYSTCKYLIQINDLNNNDIQSTEVLLMHDNSTVYLTEYATLLSDASLGSLSAEINNNNAQLIFTPSGSQSVNLSIKALKTSMF